MTDYATLGHETNATPAIVAQSSPCFGNQSFLAEQDKHSILGQATTIEQSQASFSQVEQAVAIENGPGFEIDESLLAALDGNEVEQHEAPQHLLVGQRSFQDQTLQERSQAGFDSEQFPVSVPGGHRRGTKRGALDAFADGFGLPEEVHTTRSDFEFPPYASEWDYPQSLGSASAPVNLPPSNQSDPFVFNGSHPQIEPSKKSAIALHDQVSNSSCPEPATKRGKKRAEIESKSLEVGAGNKAKGQVRDTRGGILYHDQASRRWGKYMQREHRVLTLTFFSTSGVSP